MVAVKFLHLLFLRFQLARMRDRHVELVARALENDTCESFLAAREHWQRAYHLETEMCRVRRRIRQVDMVEA